MTVDPSRSLEGSGVEDFGEEVDHGILLSARQKAALAAASYLVLCGFILVLTSSTIIESWGRVLSTGPSSNNTQWDSLAFHIALFDEEVFPDGVVDPKIGIPRDIARLPNQFYLEIEKIVSHYGGTIGREVVISLGKIQTPTGATIPQRDDYLEIIGVDEGYLEIFNGTWPPGIVDCPLCDGEGCVQCNSTGRWGRYPVTGGNEIAIPEYYMTEEELSLFFHPDSQSWIGDQVTAFYDLEGAHKTGEYTLYVGPGHVPPREGVNLNVVGVIGGRAATVVSLETAWKLKGMEQDKPSTFIYIRIPRPEDFIKAQKELSEYYAESSVYSHIPYQPEPVTNNMTEPLLLLVLLCMVILTIMLYKGRGAAYG